LLNYRMLTPHWQSIVFDIVNIHKRNVLNVGKHGFGFALIDFLRFLSEEWLPQLCDLQQWVLSSPW
jgi:hypothetical protein